MWTDGALSTSPLHVTGLNWYSFNTLKVHLTLICVTRHKHEAQGFYFIQGLPWFTFAISCQEKQLCWPLHSWHTADTVSCAQSLHQLMGVCVALRHTFILPSPSAHGHTDVAQVHLLSYTCGKNDVFIGCKIEMTPVSPAHRLCAGCKIGPVDFETKKH